MHARGKGARGEEAGDDREHPRRAGRGGEATRGKLREFGGGSADLLSDGAAPGSADLLSDDAVPGAPAPASADAIADLLGGDLLDGGASAVA